MVQFFIFFVVCNFLVFFEDFAFFFELFLYLGAIVFFTLDEWINHDCEHEVDEEETAADENEAGAENEGHERVRHHFLQVVKNRRPVVQRNDLENGN